MSNKFSCHIFFFALIFSTQSFAINKCIGSDGRVSFQDTPCPENVEFSSVIARAKNDNKSQNIDLKAIELEVEETLFSILVPAHWEESNRVLKDKLAPTLRIKPTSGSDITLLMTFIPIQNQSETNSVLLGKVMESVKRQHMSNISERIVTSRSFKQKFNDGEGKLIIFSDDLLAKKIQLPKGEYIFFTAAAVIIKNVLINITILTNDLLSDNYIKAMAATYTIYTTRPN